MSSHLFLDVVDSRSRFRVFDDVQELVHREHVFVRHQELGVVVVNVGDCVGVTRRRRRNGHIQITYFFPERKNLIRVLTLVFIDE